MRLRPVLSFLAWLALLAAVAALGAFASRDAGTFYSQLTLPRWAPPGGLFGPVWTVLYVLMAVSAWRVSGALDSDRGALLLFAAQLVANGLWSWLFFAWHLGGWAFADIVVLNLLVVATMARFHRTDSLAAWLLAPYLAWILFATLLSWSVWQANPQMLGAA